MPLRGELGAMEVLIILAVLRLDDEAYGVRVAREISEHRGRDVLIGSVYAALERLEAKGLVRSRLGEPSPERGGRAKRFFTVTALGRRRAQEVHRTLRTLAAGFAEE